MTELIEWKPVGEPEEVMRARCASRPLPHNNLPFPFCAVSSPKICTHARFEINGVSTWCECHHYDKES